MILTKELDRASELATALLGDIQLGRYERAEADCKLLLRVIDNFHHIFFAQWNEELKAIKKSKESA